MKDLYLKNDEVRTIYSPYKKIKKSLIFQPLNWANIILEIVLTETCNLRCSHCYGNYGPECKNKMSPSEVVDVIKCFKNAGGSRVVFSGGEPTMNLESLIAGLNYTSMNNMFSGIKTNATWGNKHNVDAYLSVFSAYNLSLMQVTFDKFHAENGNYWPDVKRIIDNASSYKINTYWGWGDRTNTKNDVTEFKREVYEYLGNDIVYLSRGVVGCLVGTGRAKENYKNIWPAYEDFGCTVYSWQGHFIHISIEPGNKFVFHCGARNSYYTYSYDGDWTKEAERVNLMANTRIRRLYGLQPLLKYRYLIPDALDGCDFCQQLGQLYLSGKLKGIEALKLL